MTAPTPARRSWFTTTTVVGSLQLLGIALLPFAGSFQAAVPRNVRWLLPLLLLLIVAFYVLCVLAGVALIRGHPLGRRLAVLSLLPQVIMIQTPGFAYSVANGAYCAVTTDGSILYVQAAFRGAYGVFIGSAASVQGSQQLFGINLLPLLLVILLYWNAPLAADKPA